MNPMRTLAFASTLAALLVLSPAAGAQDALQVHTQNGISYVSGGVGTGQQDRLRELGQQGYTLKLVFAEQGTGAYVADVHVTVSDRAGRTLLDVVASGPALYAKLPPGDYRVTAEYNGMRQTRTVRAGAGSPTTIHWAQEGSSAAVPASARAPHGDGAALAPGHAGEPAARGR